MFDAEKFASDLARGVIILALACLLLGGCCGGIGTYLWQTYSVNVEVKQKEKQ